MRMFKSFIRMALIGAVVVGSACTQQAADDTTTAASGALDKTKQSSDAALDATKEGTARAIDEVKEASKKTAEVTRNIAGQTVDKTKEIAVAVGGKTKEVVSSTGEVITDSWITTKVSAKFVDETILKDSHIDVDTNNHVVTLKGTVRSDPAKARAAAIARGTEGVTRVVNQLVVKGA